MNILNPQGQLEVLFRFAQLTWDMAQAPTKQERFDLLVKALKRDPYLQNYIRASLDPRLDHRFTMPLVETELPQRGSEGFIDVLRACWNGQQGPTLGAANFAGIYNKLTGQTRECAKAIINKRWDCGLNVKWINAALDQLDLELIPVFQKEQAVRWKGQDLTEDGSWYASEELVGQRCFAFVYEGVKRDPQLFTPEAVPIRCCDHIVNTLAFDWKGEPCVLEGKLFEEHPSGDDFAGVEEQVQSGTTTKINATLQVYNIIPQDVFLGGVGRQNFDASLALAKKLLPLGAGACVRPHPHYNVTSERWESLPAMAKQQGWLGIVFRRNAPYKAGLNPDIKVMDV